MILRVATLNYFKNQIKPLWQLKDFMVVMYRTLNQLNTGFISNIFQLSSSSMAARKQVLNFETIRSNQVNFGGKSLRALGPKIWNNSSSKCSVLGQPDKKSKTFQY